MTAGDGVIDLTPDGVEGTLPLPPRPAIAAVPDPVEQDEVEVSATFTLRGERFRVRDQGVSLLALMKFATIAKQRAGRGDSADDMEGLAALYALLRSCVHPDDWQAFEDHANEAGAGADDLMYVVRDAVQAAAKPRPTQPPSDSPGGRLRTGGSSAADSSSPGSSVPMGSIDVQRRYEQAGRADIAQAVKRARERSTLRSTG